MTDFHPLLLTYLWDLLSFLMLSSLHKTGEEREFGEIFTRKIQNNEKLNSNHLKKKIQSWEVPYLPEETAEYLVNAALFVGSLG